MFKKNIANNFDTYVNVKIFMGNVWLAMQQTRIFANPGPKENQKPDSETPTNNVI